MAEQGKRHQDWRPRKFQRWGSLIEIVVEGQSFSAEDRLFILMQAGLYLTATRGSGSQDAGICYERAEALCHSLNRPMLLHSALMGQWRYSLMTNKLSATMQIAERVYSLAEEQNDSALIGACTALATTLYFLGDFETARQYAIRGIQIWRSGNVQSPIEELDAPAVLCLCYEAVLEWHAGEITSCHATMAEAISLAKELRDMHALAEALCWAAVISYCERDPAEVERYASEFIELSTRSSFAHWRAVGAIYKGWARSASGDTAAGVAWIEDGIRDWLETGAVRLMPVWLSLKAEALYLADRTSEALEAIQKAVALSEGSGEREWYPELQRLRGAFLVALEPRALQLDRFAGAFSVAGEKQERAADEKTLVLPGRFSGNPDIEKARAEFERAQKIEEAFHMDLDGIDFTRRSIGGLIGVYLLSLLSPVL